VICGGVAALFVSAARAPAPRRVFLVVVSSGTSCQKPPYPLSLEQCMKLRKEVKAIRLGALSLPPLPSP
jgi:hypothetical protein